jgi:hypothetical protein
MQDWLRRYSHFYCGELNYDDYADDEAYYNSQTSADFPEGPVRNYPPRALWMAMKIAQNFLPDTGVAAELITGRSVVLTDSATDEALREQIAIIAGKSVTGAEQRYKKAIVRLMEMRLKVRETRVAHDIINAVKQYLTDSGDPDSEATVTAYFKSIFPYENYIAALTEAAYQPVPYDGFPDYINIA